MNDEIKADDDLYTFISLEEFKALMGIDDRDDKLCRFCLVTSSLTIEEYCKRKFLKKKYFETFQIDEKLLFILKEYPVCEIISVFDVNKDTLIDPVFYRSFPGCAYDEEFPFELILSPSLKPYKMKTVKITYVAGYEINVIPKNLSAACLEFASWNFNRYKGKRIGMTGNIRGAGVQGEHFEMSMPENVRCLIEPYKRKTI